MNPRYLLAAPFVALSGVHAAIYMSLNTIAEFIIGEDTDT